jgi:hypothetical protein
MNVPITNYKTSNGSDLNNIFAKYRGGTQASLTKYKVGTTDLNAIFSRYLLGTQAGATGYKVGTNDLSTILQPYKNYVKNFDFAGSGLTASNWSYWPSTISSTEFGYSVPDPEYPANTANLTTTALRCGFTANSVSDPNLRFAQFLGTLDWPLTTGRQYTLSFWLRMGTGTGTMFLKILYAGVELFNTTTPNDNYVFYEIFFSSTSEYSFLEIQCRNVPSYIYITRVRITYP